MKEKIKTICLMLITVGALVLMWIYIQKGMLYLNAYEDCMKSFNLSWQCVRILNGGGGQ